MNRNRKVRVATLARELDEDVEDLAALLGVKPTATVLPIPAIRRVIAHRNREDRDQ